MRHLCILDICKRKSTISQKKFVDEQFNQNICIWCNNKMYMVAFQFLHKCPSFLEKKHKTNKQKILSKTHTHFIALTNN